MRDLIIAFVVGLLVASGAAYKIHTWRVASLRTEWATEKDKAVTDAKAAVQAVCDENNKSTMEQAHALRTKYDIINRNYDSLLRHSLSGTSSTTPPGAAGGGNGTPGANVPTVLVPAMDGLTAGRLNDKQAADLITLQDIVAGIYKANGQADLLPVEYRFNP